MQLNDVVEVLKILFLFSIASSLTIPFYFYFAYRFSKLYVEFKGVSERVDFIEESIKQDLVSSIHKNLNNKE